MFLNGWIVPSSQDTDVYKIFAIDVLNSSYNGTYNISINAKSDINYTKEKEDSNYVAIIDNANLTGTEFNITFHHNSLIVHPITIIGDINYTLNQTSSNGSESVNLIVHDYTDQWFRIAVGNGTDLFGFGKRKNKKLQNSVQNHLNISQQATLKFKDKWLNKFEYNQSTTDHNATIPEGEYDLEVIPTNSKIKSIKFIKFKMYKNITTADLFLKLGDFVQNITLPEGKQTDNRFAIDPSALDFADAIVTVNATGNVLYKCEAWNFTLQECFGSWNKLQDLIP